MNVTARYAGRYDGERVIACNLPRADLTADDLKSFARWNRERYQLRADFSGCRDRRGRADCIGCCAFIEDDVRMNVIDTR